MNPMDIVFERTVEEKRIHLEKIRAELKLEGYSVVLTSWLQSFPKRVEEMAEGVRI